MRKIMFLMMLVALLIVCATVGPANCAQSQGVQPASNETPVLYDPFDRENPVVKLPDVTLSYVRGHDGEAIYFDGKTYLREPALTFIPAEKNWVEGAVSFWLKPAKYPAAPENVPIVLFNWFDYLKPQSGYVGDISLTSEGKIVNNGGWEWGGGNPPVITSRSPVPLDTWTHVAVVWSKVEGYTRIYINNKMDAEIESYCARGSNGCIYPWLAGYGGFVGALDELKIYKVPVAPPFNQSVVAQSPKEEPGFEGDWIVSDYQAGGNKTLKYEGDTVTIVKRDDVYYIDGPTWFFAETKFKLDGNTLAGTNIPDMERLKQNWPTTPAAALGSAYGRIVFKGTLKMLKDGRIAGEQDNWMISIFRDTGRLKSVKRYPKYTQFILTRKK